MWRIGLLAITACWMPTAPSDVRAAVNAGCEIRDKDVITPQDITLHVGGISYATVPNELTRLDVVLVGAAAHVEVETTELELAGDVKVARLPVRKRMGLHDDWLGIRVAQVRAERDGVVEVSVPLPDGVRPRVFVAKLACADLTFEDPAYSDEKIVTTEGTEILELVPGTTTELAKTPGGPPVVELVPASPLRAEVIERRGAFARIEISDENTITGWVSTAHTRQAPPVEKELFGYGRIGTSHRTVRCLHDVPIYVDTGAKVHRVGRYKAGASILYDGPSIDDPSVGAEARLRVELGDGERAPHVKRADLVGCARH